MFALGLSSLTDNIILLWVVILHLAIALVACGSIAREGVANNSATNRASVVAEQLNSNPSVINECVIKNVDSISLPQVVLSSDPGQAVHGVLHHVVANQYPCSKTAVTVATKLPLLMSTLIHCVGTCREQLNSNKCASTATSHMSSDGSCWHCAIRQLGQEDAAQHAVAKLSVSNQGLQQC